MLVIYTILVIVITLLTLSILASCYNNINNFKNDKPRARFPDLVKEFGENYMLFTDSSGGIVRWEHPKFYESIMLLDESIEHKKPEPHCDFLYATIKVYIPQESLQYVLGLSESVYYDRLKSLLTVRCHFMGAIVSTMLLALLIAEEPSSSGTRSVNYRTKYEHYYKKYGPLIMSSMKKERYIEIEETLKGLIKENNEKYQKKFAKKCCN